MILKMELTDHKSIFEDKVNIGGREIDGDQLKWSTFHGFPAGNRCYRKDKLKCCSKVAQDCLKKLASADCGC